MLNQNTQICLCGSGINYSECCQLLHNGSVAKNAESLMRSRYSAYVLGLYDYLARTWHASTLPNNLREKDADKTQWLGLKIKRFVELDECHAEVEFVARYKIDGRAYRLHECSQFVCEEGRWLYINGDVF
jgi:SEC-C motif-containing protein